MTYSINYLLNHPLILIVVLVIIVIGVYVIFKQGHRPIVLLFKRVTHTEYRCKYCGRTDEYEIYDKKLKEGIYYGTCTYCKNNFEIKIIEL